MTRIDFRSDTVTRPTPAMREAMARADVGDDVYGEDPTVNRLQEAFAARLGKEAALFVPSGTMANQIALRSLSEPGDAAIVARDAHIFLYESGAGAALGGVQFNLIGENGAFGADELREAIYPGDDHFARTRLVSIENTHNRSGGRVFPFERLREVTELARARGLLLHLDGARLWNAEAATGIEAARWAEPFDTVSCCLSKGLGAPVGSLVASTRARMERLHRLRKMQGGGMRQAGILAAAGLYALEHHVKRLADDHAHARRLAAGLATLSGVTVSTPETNIVVFRHAGAPALCERLRARGVLMSALSGDAVRAVTHLDVSAQDVDRALAIVREEAR
ncbi:MAG TPA: low-specificity L-threonine aldolase [Myxococcota bacterium]|nr:low-specificity L-threonine aldolase [Myxococcota bacterium]